VPGGPGHIEIGGADANAGYCGITFSTPIVLPLKQANAQGKLIYDIAVPRDFELAAPHHIDLFRNQVQVASFDFCVAANGKISPNSACAKAPTTPTSVKPGGNLAKTGSNVMDIVRIALIAIAVGAAAVYARRRLQSRTA
jgi:hypothetical protein